MPGKTGKERRGGATGQFERFRRSGFGQVAEGLFVIKRENPKTFWIGVFLFLWMVANGFNNIGNLITLVKEGRSLVTLLNPVAVDAPKAVDTTGVN